jgi:N4-gp56 family major capsid protein
MSTKTLFNTGGLTTTDIDEQYNDKFWSKGAIMEAMRKRTFTQLGDRLTQPKHYGDEIVKERHLPILHPMNQLDGGISGETAVLLQSVFYAYNEAGSMIGTYETRDYATAQLAYDAAKTAADAAQAGDGTVKNGAGSLYNGDADYSVVKGSFPTLTEIGGNVNGVNTKSITIRGNVAEFGMHMKFTQRAIDMDSRVGVLAQKTKDLGEAKGDIFESQVQADLIAASEINRVYAGTVADSLVTCNQSAVLTFADLRLMEQELKRLLIPRDTKIITGSTKIGTKVVQKAFYVYVGQELYPVLQDMQHNSVNVWEALETYKDAAGSNVAEGEIGRIGGFRFIEVANMLKYAGKGTKDSGLADTSNVDGWQASNIPFGDADAGSVGFDVFPVLFVGSDSFATVGFAGDSSKIKTAMPKADAHLDPFGKNGSMSIAWYFGTLIYKSERIRQIACTAPLV